MWILSAEMCPTSTSLMWTNWQFVHINNGISFRFGVTLEFSHFCAIYRNHGIEYA